MNRNRQNIILSCLVLFANTLSFAQTNDGNVEDVNIIVTKDKKIDLPLASRNFEKIDEPAKEIKVENLNYNDLNSKILSLPTIDAGLRVLKIKDEPSRIHTANYVEGGFGNYLTTYLNANLASINSNKYAYSAQLYHLSSANGPVDYSGNSRNKIGFNGDYFLTKSSKFTSSVNYNRNALRYYGYNPAELSLVDEDSIKQSYNTISAKLGVESNNNTFNYKLNAIFSYLMGRYDISDMNYGYKFSGNYNLADESSVIVSSELMMENFQMQGFTSNRTYFNLNPSYKFLKDGINITAGFNTAYDNDTLNGQGGFHIYPHIYANYPLFVNELNLFAGITGGLERNSFSSLLNNNMFYVPDAAFGVFNSNKTFDLFAGMRGNFEQKLGYAARVSYQTYNNLYFFQNNPLDNLNFIAITDAGNVNILNLNGELTYELSERLTANAKFDYNEYTTSTLAAPFYKPAFTSAIGMAYNFQKKIRMNAELNYITGLQGFRNGAPKYLKDITDINLGINYKISDKFSTFVMLNNVLGRKYYYYINYQARGFNAIVGAAYSF